MSPLSARRASSAPQARPSEALPASLVAPGDPRGRALAPVACAQREAPLASVEEATLAATRAAMPGWLGALLRERTASPRPGGVGRTPARPRRGERALVQRWRERTVTTVGGTLTPERPWDHHRRWLHGWSPTDRTWRLAARARISAGLAGWRIDRGASAGVADARRELGRLTGLAVAAETIRVTTAATMVVAEGISVA